LSFFGFLEIFDDLWNSFMSDIDFARQTSGGVHGSSHEMENDSTGTSEARTTSSEIVEVTSQSFSSDRGVVHDGICEDGTLEEGGLFDRTERMDNAHGIEITSTNNFIGEVDQGLVGIGREEGQAGGTGDGEPTEAKRGRFAESNGTDGLGYYLRSCNEVRAKLDDWKPACFKRFEKIQLRNLPMHFLDGSVKRLGMQYSRRRLLSGKYHLEVHIHVWILFTLMTRGCIDAWKLVKKRYEYIELMYLHALFEKQSELSLYNVWKNAYRATRLSFRVHCKHLDIYNGYDYAIYYMGGLDERLKFEVSYPRVYRVWSSLFVSKDFEGKRFNGRIFTRDDYHVDGDGLCLCFNSIIHNLLWRYDVNPDVPMVGSIENDDGLIMYNRKLQLLDQAQEIREKWAAKKIQLWWRNLFWLDYKTISSRMDPQVIGEIIG
jgi:hypothetical protein